MKAGSHGSKQWHYTARLPLVVLRGCNQGQSWRQITVTSSPLQTSSFLWEGDTWLSKAGNYF